MKLRPHIRRFAVREDGTLLVFFMISAIAILGIVALSFDLGRRASTQTDMQAFVDNVALAAAGELDGSLNAIDNATRAANTVIDAANQRLRAGTAGQDFTIALDQIVFYRQLPDRDTPTSFDVAQIRNPDSANYKYALPPTDLGETPDPREARFVGVRLRSVDVPWIFAGVFSASDLPDASVGGVAVAGLSGWLCDHAPVLFCLPNDEAGEPLALGRGQGAQLRTARQNLIWREGDFGFVRVDHDPAGRCDDVEDIAGRLACLVTLENRTAACFQPRQVNAETGQRPNQTTGAFDMAFDVFEDEMLQFITEPEYAPGPSIMSYPLDDCHADGECENGAFGDGEWAEGRETYLDQNYPVEGLSLDGLDDGSFFDFPEPRLSRYRFYRREIERARSGGVLRFAGTPPYDDPQYLPDNDGGRGTGSPEDVSEYTTWDDFWEDDPVALNPIVPDALDAAQSGLAVNNDTNQSASRDNRRVILAAGIHCPTSGNVVRGNAQGLEIEDFYRLFLLSPTSDVVGFPPRFNLNVEVVRRIPVEDLAPYREVVQLYR